MSDLTIRTNHQPRHTILGVDLTQKEREEFDYLSGEELDFRSFARYRGQVYDLGEFITTTPGPWNHGLPDPFKAWHGYASDSFFSGVLIRYPEPDCETVIFGTYYS